MTAKYQSHILGTGSYLPEKIISNEVLSQTVDTSDEWIRQRTGITQRHLAAEGELTSDLALAAAKKAMAAAKITADQLDLIIVATTTADQSFPATAVKVQAALGMTHGFAFDVQAVCSGFVYALATADNFIKSGQVKHALVIGAETFSRLLDWQDRTTCVLFGDGAGAVVLGAGDESRGILSTHLFSDGRYVEHLHADGGISSTQSVGVTRMNGGEVFKHAVNKLSQAVDHVLDYHKLDPAEIDWLVPHQANIRIIEAMARKLKLPVEKVVITIDQHANTSAASIPLALDQAVCDGRIQPGQLLLLEAMGAGFTWGASLIRF